MTKNDLDELKAERRKALTRAAEYAIGACIFTAAWLLYPDADSGVLPWRSLFALSVFVGVVVAAIEFWKARDMGHRLASLS